MTLAHYLDVVRRARPGHDLGDATLHRGQSHDVLLTADRVFRFPRTASAAAALPRRAALAAAVAALDLGVRVPVPSADVDLAAPVGERFLELDRVPGAPLDRVGAARVDGVAAGFARLLRVMADRRPADVPTADPHRWAEFADGVHSGLFPLMAAAGRERAERELAAVLALDHVATGLVHGDLGGENVLWDEADPPRLVGVVDWDGAVVGDPAEDLAAVGASYGPALLDRVIGLLGLDRAVVGPRIRAYQGTFALQQALAGALDGDDAERDDGLAGYR
ncbi:capreomycin phosphotransferase [Saccharothrix australiensis]|uniref:Phosphotransferase family enzyme n=1 Tax=Saccharothrix australiensis TaxID=2072 RepID=A0A495W315_9PSEU|nr:capreomycin phosphotransferase [Saccharothrix australiensis]RKT55734.1 phosphotransferase family enzyme [Saccharothrix australiensis]